MGIQKFGFLTATHNSPIDSGKTVEAVALPPLGSVAGYNPALHVFSMAIGG